MTTVELSTGPAWDPQRPATRIYISGYRYVLSSTPVPNTSLAQTVKLVLNWLSSQGPTAKNIMYMLFSGGAPTSDSTFLGQVANAIMTTWASSGLPSKIQQTWSLQKVTAKDNSGTSAAVADSTHAAIPGTDAALPLPPQVSIALSWDIAAHYRGGKPRTYLPGVPQDSLVAIGNSAIIPSFAVDLAAKANTWSASVNVSSPGGHDGVLGTLSFRTGNAPRPTPLFRAFGEAHVHERLDSQRRRSGRESAFGETP